MTNNTRRDFVKQAALGSAALLALPTSRAWAQTIACAWE